MSTDHFGPPSPNWTIVTIPEPRSAHAVPIFDSADHKDENCPCGPVYEGTTLAGPAWTHKSFDGREAFEDGSRKPS
jgi:hypothetical protein